MEDKKEKSFYSLAKYPTYEILMEGQLASAGAHQAKLIEKLKKNNKYIKHQFLVMKFVFAFLFVFLPLLPLTTYFQIAENLSFYSINTIFFVSSILFMIFFGMTIMYLLMFGMISTGSFMSGNAFKWLQTLPFSKKSLKKIGLMTLFRNLDVPIIILIAGFPIIMFIATQDIIIFLFCLIVSVVNVIFGFSILVIVGEKMSHLFSESKVKSKRAGLIRTITMLGYFIIMFTAGFIFSLGVQAVEGLFDIFTTNEPPFILIIILSLIPFLFAPAFLVSLNTLQFQVHPILILTTLTGFALSIILTWVIFKIAQRALHSAISTEIKTEKVEKRETEFEINPISPIKAYLRKDIVSSTRDIQSFMFIFFPIFYPLIMILSMSGLFFELVFSIESILFMWSIILMVYMFIPIMLIVGFLNLEESGSSTLASLPLVPRDQAKAKLILMLSIQGVSLIVTSIVLTLLLNSLIVVLLLLITLPIAWTFLFLIFILKIKFFGKMKYKYILEELHKEHKIGKWIILILSQFGLYVAILIIGNILIYIFGITIALITLGVIGLLCFTLIVFIFNRMFPKVEKLAEYKTGGFLREHVNVSTLSIKFGIWSNFSDITRPTPIMD
jgi:predicted permease